MKTLNLQQAAALLLIHPVTLQAKARAGEIPGAKPGRRWVFVEDDLRAYLRAQYARRALQGDSMENVQCRSTDARIHLTGGSSCPTTAARYSEALGLPTGTRHGSTTTSSRRSCGT
ncbi:MAG: helix-turn-helix domain-containing protein [Steroidobacteraceae bacterium]|nr:helix-turn-helix domain-containing protein [Steroidobacteraceae bacterium]MCW5571743.1 helix-turn-helix domain-containing protein [Steroidobacteraceae bacterium]